MPLTDSKKQIGFMVSCNPVVENTKRVAGLSDDEVLAELTTFKAAKLSLLQQEQTMIQNDQANCLARLADLAEKITLLES